MEADQDNNSTRTQRRFFQRRISKRVVRGISLGALVVLCLGVGAGFVVLRVLSRDLPSPARLQTIRPPSKTLIFAANGDTLHEYFTQNRVNLPLEQVPEGLIHAVIATEDRRFYQHYGVDLGGILRAIFVDVRTGQRGARRVYPDPAVGEKSLSLAGQTLGAEVAGAASCPADRAHLHQG